MNQSRSFGNYDSFTTFHREHLGGTMHGCRLKGAPSWSLTVRYEGYALGQARFKRIRDGERWAIGLLRKARAGKKVDKK